MDLSAEIQVLTSVVYAMVLGGVIGFERELKDRPAGFRTHMLVAGAASLLVGMGWMAMHQAKGFESEMLKIDPLRLVEAVIAGVSFIGAGTIFARRGKGSLVGITTAASLLMVAAIGISTGLGFNLLALAVTLLTLVVLGALRQLERRMADVAKKNSDD